MAESSETSPSPLLPQIFLMVEAMIHESLLICLDYEVPNRFLPSAQEWVVAMIHSIFNLILKDKSAHCMSPFSWVIISCDLYLKGATANSLVV